MSKKKSRILNYFMPAPRPRYSNRLSYDDLINLESHLGGTLFGPIPAGHQREFFKHKDNVWIWYEKWHDHAGNLQEMTVRYEVQPAGVFMRASGENYKKLSGAELYNFCNATERYLKLVKTKLYS